MRPMARSLFEYTILKLRLVRLVVFLKKNNSFSFFKKRQGAQGAGFSAVCFSYQNYTFLYIFLTMACLRMGKPQHLVGMSHSLPATICYSSDRCSHDNRTLLGYSKAPSHLYLEGKSSNPWPLLSVAVSRDRSRAPVASARSSSGS